VFLQVVVDQRVVVAVVIEPLAGVVDGECLREVDHVDWLDYSSSPLVSTIAALTAGAATGAIGAREEFPVDIATYTRRIPITPV